MKRFAEYISWIFHFIFIAPITVALMMHKFPIESSNWNWIYPALLFTTFYIVPLLIVTFFYKTGRISDFDVTERSERNLLNLVVFSFIFIASIGLLFAPIPLVYKFSTVYTLVFAIVFGVVTYFWKISYHMGALGWFLSTIIFLYGLTLFTVTFSIVLSFLMAWSRIYLKKHTLLQTIVGLAVSTVLYFLLYKLFFLN